MRLVGVGGDRSNKADERQYMFFQCGCLLGSAARSRPDRPLSARSSHQTNGRFSDQLPRSGPTGVNPQLIFGAYLNTFGNQRFTAQASKSSISRHAITATAKALKPVMDAIFTWWRSMEVLHRRVAEANGALWRVSSIAPFC